MIQCPHCGKSNADTARFCIKCGTTLNAAPSQEPILISECPKCGYRPENPSKFCIRCGASLVVAAPPTQQTHATAQANAAQATTPSQGTSNTTTPPSPEPQQYRAPNQHTTQEAQPPKQPPYQAHQYGAPPQQPSYSAQQYGAQQPYASPYSSANMLVSSLCSKLRVSSILCLITGCIQGITAIVLIIVGIVAAAGMTTVVRYTSYYSYYYSYSSHYDDEVAAVIASMIIAFIFGALCIVGCICNLVSAARTFKYITRIRNYPAGILLHFQSAGKTIALLILNIICGGIIGIIGSAFALAARSHVRNNAGAFQAIEDNLRNQ